MMTRCLALKAPGSGCGDVVVVGECETGRLGLGSGEYGDRCAGDREALVAAGGGFGEEHCCGVVWKAR